MNGKSTLDLLNTIGFAVGVIGLLIAIWQVISARRTRHMYREKCETRCKDLVETVGELEYAVNQACRIKDNDLDNLMAGNLELGKAIRPFRQLSDQIHSIYVTKNQLVRFCERLNDEHLMEFKEPVFKDIRDKFADISKDQARIISLNNSNKASQSNREAEKVGPSTAS